MTDETEQVNLPVKEMDLVKNWRVKALYFRKSMAQDVRGQEHMHQGGPRLPTEFVRNKKSILCTAKSRSMINMMQKQHSTNAK